MCEFKVELAAGGLILRTVWLSFIFLVNRVVYI